MFKAMIVGLALVVATPVLAGEILHRGGVPALEQGCVPLMGYPDCDRGITPNWEKPVAPAWWSNPHYSKLTREPNWWRDPAIREQFLKQFDIRM